VKRIDYKARGK